MARITMPQLGETVTEGTITAWLKQVGDDVEVDEPLLEVATDKVQTEIPSAFGGRLLRVDVAEGETVPIGAVLCVIGDDEEDAAVAHGGTHGSPRAFRQAMEGGGGYLQPPVVHHGHREPRRPAPRQVADHATIDVDIDDDEVTRVPFSVIRRRTAEHLTSSLHTAAHTLTVVEVDFSAVDEARVGDGRHLTYLPFVARAVCDALGRFEHLNASVRGEELLVHRSVHLGVAVDLDHQGLVVPVVRDAGSLRIGELDRRLRDLASRARGHRLAGDETAGGTFTITNAGGRGTFVTAPIINPPQVAILSTDGVAMRPVAVALPGGGHGVGVRPVGNLSLSFDHRAVDGAYASGFLAEVRTILQSRDWTVELGRSVP